MVFLPKWHEENVERLNKLAPRTKSAAFKWYRYCIDNRIDVYVVATERTEEQQRQFVASGKSQTMMSYHLVGQALDFVPVIDGKINWDAYWQEPFKSCIEYAKSIGFEWGGDWKGFVDAPHLQFVYKGYGTDRNEPIIYYIQTGGFIGEQRVKEEMEKLQDETGWWMKYEKEREVPVWYIETGGLNSDGVKRAIDIADKNTWWWKIDAAKGKTATMLIGGFNSEADADALINKLKAETGWWMQKKDIGQRQSVYHLLIGGFNDEGLEKAKKVMEQRGWWYTIQES